MSEVLGYRDRFGNEHKVELLIDRYLFGNNLCIRLEEIDEGPYATLTVNLTDCNIPKNYAFVDTNNCPEAPEFIVRHGLGRKIGIHKPPGSYCTYPLYEFDVDKLHTLCNMAF